MVDYFKEEAKKDFKDMMSQMLSNPPPELMQQLVSAMSVQQMTAQAPQLQLVPTMVTQTIVVPSSVASMGHKDHYPIDDIDMSVPCSLVIRYGINNIHTREVAIGFATLGRQYHAHDILEEYCRVEVSTVVQGYEDDMLEIPHHEGIEKLGQAIKNFILWPRRDVQLCELPPPPSQIKSVPNPPSSPTQSLPTPPSLPSSPILPPLDPPSSPTPLSSPPQPFNYPASPPHKDPE